MTTTQSRLEAIKSSIEKMEPTRQKEVLALLNRKGHVPISQNRNGSFVNLSCLRPGDIKGLEEFVSHVEKQKQALARDERQKAELRDEFFNKDKAISYNMC